MIYKFIDNKGTFTVSDPQHYNLYFPLTNAKGNLLSSISPNLAGDIKRDDDHFLTVPASIEDLRSNLLCRRDFFIKTKREIIRLSSPYTDKLEAGLLYHKITKTTSLLEIEILNFIPYNLDAEVMWIKIKNKSAKDITITPTSFVPLYGRSEKSLRDHRHVSSLLNRIKLEKYGIILKPTMCFDEQAHSANKTNYFCFGWEDNAITPIGQFPTLDYFYGKGNINHPDAVEKDLKPVNKKVSSFDGKEVCAAFRFKKKKLKKKETVNYFILMGISDNANKIHSDFHRLNSQRKVELSLEETKKYWQKTAQKIELKFHNKNFSNWLVWVKLQPTLRKLFGCSFLPHFDYGKGGRGWRDLWQDALTLLLTESNESKKIITDSFKGIRIDGSNATIITKNNNFLSDRNKISRVWMDHGVWPCLTLALYMNRTADISILLKNATYFRDHQLKRARKIDPCFSQNDYILRTKNNKIYKGSILEHLLIQNLVQFFNVGDHNIIKLENADWNDGLDMAPQKGESVAFSSMYAYNLENLCFFLEKLKNRRKSVFLLKEIMLLLDRIRKPINYNNFKAKQKRLNDYLRKTTLLDGKKVKVDIDDLIYDLKEKSKHLSEWIRKKEWLREGFFNGYYDNKGKRVEGKSKGKVKMMLASQVFPIMSGCASKPQIKKTWLSIKKYLKDNKLKGFKLNTDFGHLYLDLGRAFGFSYGDKENGAFFNHMTTMLANALYKQGFIKEGLEVMASIYTLSTNQKAKIYPLIPEYFNQQGEGLYLYLTGSASWYIHTLVEEALGIKFILGDLFLSPKISAKSLFATPIEVKLNIYGKKIKILFLKRGKKGAFIGKKEIPFENGGFLIKKALIKKLKQKEIIIKVFIA